MENIIGKRFTAANQLKTSRKIRKLIVSQPGYQRGMVMQVLKAKTGGLRLYAWYSWCGKWMDTSLKDINQED